jgi:hypothetical protein
MRLPSRGAGAPAYRSGNHQLPAGPAGDKLMLDASTCDLFLLPAVIDAPLSIEPTAERNRRSRTLQPAYPETQLWPATRHTTQTQRHRAAGTNLRNWSNATLPAGARQPPGDTPDRDGSSGSPQPQHGRPQRHPRQRYTTRQRLDIRGTNRCFATQLGATRSKHAQRTERRPGERGSRDELGRLHTGCRRRTQPHRPRRTPTRCRGLDN